jgi:hypothetical protein
MEYYENSQQTLSLQTFIFTLEYQGKGAYQQKSAGAKIIRGV